MLLMLVTVISIIVNINNGKQKQHVEKRWKQAFGGSMCYRVGVIDLVSLTTYYELDGVVA